MQVLDLCFEDSQLISNDVSRVKTHVLRVGRRSRLSKAQSRRRRPYLMVAIVSVSTLGAQSMSLHHDGVQAPNISSVTYGP
jgi:hypothetical protein